MRRKARPSRGGALYLGVFEAREEVLLLLARRGDVAHLDVAEAADFLRQRRKLDGKRMVRGRKLREHALEGRFVLGDERSLGAPLRGVAEWIERRAAQAAHGLQEAENWQHPGAKTHLARLARHRVLARQQRRRKVENELGIALQ